MESQSFALRQPGWTRVSCRRQKTIDCDYPQRIKTTDMKDQAAQGGSVRKPSLSAVLVGIIPYVAMCFSVSLWDRVTPLVLGLPFNLFWLALWILLTPLCMAGASRFDGREESANSRKSKDTSQ